MKSPREEIQKLFTDSDLCRKFIDASPDAIVVLAPNGDILAYNDNAIRLFGFGGAHDVPANVIGMYDDISERENLLSSLLEKGIISDFEIRMNTPEGPMIISVNASVFEFGGDSVHIAILRDISARRAAEESLKKSEEKFSRLFEAASDAILLFDERGDIIDCNQAAIKLFVCTKKELLNSSFLDFAPQVQPGGRISKEYFYESLSDVRNSYKKRILWRHRLKGGTLLDCNISLSTVEVGDSSLFMCVVFDLSEQQKMLAKGKLDEMRFEALSAISRMGEADLSSIYEYALEAAVSITESTIGYLYFLNDDETELSLHAWSKNVMGRCQVENFSNVYRVEDTGIWGDAIRLRQPIILNDYLKCPHKKGIPVGHVPVYRHMNVPLFDGDRIVLLAGVGNKEDEYTQEDVRQLTMLMEGMWNVVRRRQADDALREAYAGLEKTVFDRTEKLSFALANLRQRNSEIRKEMEYRKQVEDQLKESAGRLSLATRSGGFGVWEWNLVKNKLVWDDRMFEMYRCSSDDFAGVYEAWQSRVHPEDLAGAEMVLSEAIESDGYFDWEFRIVLPDGEIRHIKANGLGLHDAEGRIHTMIGINSDVTDRRRLEERLRRFERIIAVTPDLISLVDSDYRFVMVNDAYMKAFDKPRSYFEGKLLVDVIGQDIFFKYSKPMIDAAFAGEIRSVEVCSSLPALGERCFSVTYQPVDSPGDDEQFVAIAAHDVTPMKLAEEDRRHIFEVSIDMLGVVDFEGLFVEMNPAWHNILGWTEEELKGKFWGELVHPEDRKEADEAFNRLLSGEMIKGLENRYMCSNSDWCWISWNLHADREQKKITAVGRDVTVQKEMVDELKRIASTDALTGANNRRCFLDRAKEEIDRFVRYGGSLSLMMLDIDHFKKINDSYGHDAGDKVLQELVRCSKETLRASDLFGRIGGEEFAALLVHSDEDAVKVAERLRETLSRLDVQVGSEKIGFTVSIGLTWIDKDNPSIEEVMKQADRCLYKAKEEGRNRVVSG